MQNNISIQPYASGLAPHFARLNKAWIQKYFTLEPLDEAMLDSPEENIIQKNGHIYFAFYKGELAGTFALLQLDETTFELSKMAVDEAFQGLKVGNAMLQAALEEAKKLGAQQLVLYSNTILQPAIHLYKKFGFTEVPLAYTEYKRSNIKMKKELL